MRRASRLAVLAVPTLVLPVASARAQVTWHAWVVTNATDPSTGLPVGGVAPGQTIRLRTVVSWASTGTSNASQMAGLKGDMLAALATGPLAGEGRSSAGLVSNRVSDYTQGSLVNLGTLDLDDIRGIDIAVTPMFFTGGWIVPPSSNWSGINIVGYDWKAPTIPGNYEFKFQPSPDAPNLRIYPSYSSPQFIDAQTQYFGASITVTPAASTLPALALGALAALRRRR